jgi:hypothetical protein
VQPSAQRAPTALILDREARQIGSAAPSRLVSNAVEVGSHGPDRDVEALGDFSIGVALGQ